MWQPRPVLHVSKCPLQGRAGKNQWQERTLFLFSWQTKERMMSCAWVQGVRSEDGNLDLSLASKVLKGEAGPKCQPGAAGWCPEGLILHLSVAWPTCGKKSPAEARPQGSNFPLYDPPRRWVTETYTSLGTKWTRCSLVC